MTVEKVEFNSRRSAVYGINGMVTSLQPFATQIGLDILKKGGNAADASVAMAFAIGLLDPRSNNLGGNALCLFYDAKNHKVNCLDGSGRTSSKMTLEHALNDLTVKKTKTLIKSIHSVTVPGAPAAFIDTLELFGSGNFDLKTIMQPAIDLAENGYPISQVSSFNWKIAVEKIVKLGFHHNHDWLIDEIRGPEAGEVFFAPNYANTLKKIAKEGKDGFYKGEIANRFVDTVQKHGGLITLDDLKNHKTEIVEPISIDYRDITVWQVPPPSQSVTTLMALGIIEALEDQIPGKVDHFHLVIEALRLAFEDTKRYIGDGVSLEGLLNKEYLRERAKLIDFERKNDNVLNGYPDNIGNTTCFSVVDKKGNACSFMISIGTGFNTLPCVSGTGILFQDRGAFFSLEKGHPNCIGPNKKPFHTLMPGLITRKNENNKHEFEATLGIMGLFMQHQGQLQCILKHNLSSNPQRILDAPRMSITPSLNYRYDLNNLPSYDYEVIFEEGVDDKVIKELEEKKGHRCKVVPMNISCTFGHGNMIISKIDERSRKRVLVGGCDPRSDGHASGW